jgi:hypothetical protein
MNGLLSGTACTTTTDTMKFGFAQRATTTAAAQSHTSLLFATTAVMRGKEEVDVHDGRAERILINQGAMLRSHKVELVILGILDVSAKSKMKLLTRIDPSSFWCCQLQLGSAKMLWLCMAQVLLDTVVAHGWTGLDGTLHFRAKGKISNLKRVPALHQRYLIAIMSCHFGRFVLRMVVRIVD